MVRRRVLANLVDRERIAGLQRVDGHVLGAVVLEDPVDVRGPRDQGEIAQEDPDLDDPLERRLRPTLVGARGGHARDEQRQQREDRDGDPERDQQHDDDRALAELDVVLLGLDVGAADQPARADDQRLVQDDESTNERPLGRAVRVEAGIQSLRGGDDPTVRVAQRHGDRIATAHEHAFHEGLAPVRVTGHAGKSTGRGPKATDGADRERPAGLGLRREPVVGSRSPGAPEAGPRPGGRGPGIGTDPGGPGHVERSAALAAGLALQALLEALDLPGGVDDVLRAREERVAVGCTRRRAAPVAWTRRSTRGRTSRSAPWPRSTWDGCRASRWCSPPTPSVQGHRPAGGRRLRPVGQAAVRRSSRRSRPPRPGCASCSWWRARTGPCRSRSRTRCSPCRGPCRVRRGRSSRAGGR